MKENIRLAKELVKVARALVSSSEEERQKAVNEFYSVIKSVLPSAYKITSFESWNGDYRWTVKRPCSIDGVEIDSALSGQKGVIFDFAYSPYDRNNSIYSIINYAGVNNLKKLGINWPNDMPRAADLKSFKQKASSFFNKLEKSILKHSGIKSKKDRIMNDLKNIFKVPVETVSVNGSDVKISVAGKAYGDGYDFSEKYVNGRCVDNKCNSSSIRGPLFNKEAKYLYDTYKMKNIEMFGYYD